MFRKTLIALAATAALGGAMTTTAEAHHHKFIVDIGFGGWGGGYGGGYCGYEAVPVKKWNKWHDAYKIIWVKQWVCY
ncbi:hypothetical protein [Aestuariivirga sp.]|uniref:hypothetical protein n=1 Tax=Aestuariivirga sp. TaxID=2650926 RepID=UPI0039E64202